MKTQKSLKGVLPLHYWTGILGGTIYAVWTGITFALHSFHYYGRSILVWTMLTVIDLPTHLRNIVSDLLIDRALEKANGASVYTVPYLIAGYFIPFVIFVLVGMIIGIRSDDPKREAVRKGLLKAFFAIVIFLWIFGSCVLTLFYFMLD
jgi:hypothetical protein